MRVGFTLPQVGPLAHEAPEIARFAREAEQLGVDHALELTGRILDLVRAA